MKLCPILFLAVLMIGVASADVSIVNNVNFNLDNNAFIKVLAVQNSTNITLYNSTNTPAPALQFYINGTPTRFTANTNKTLSNISYNNITDITTYTGNGTAGYLNVSTRMNSSLTFYNFKVDGGVNQTLQSNNSGWVTFNYTGWSQNQHDFEISKIVPTYAPSITSWWNSINGWNQTAMSINAGNSATFNVTVNQTPTAVAWKVEGSEEQNTSSLQFSRAFNTIGAYNVTMQAFNANGSSNVVYTVVTVTESGGGGTDYDYAYGWVKYPNGTGVNGAIIYTSAGNQNTNSNGYYAFSYVFEHGLSYNFNITKVGHNWSNQTVSFTTGDYQIVNTTIDVIVLYPPNITSWSNSNTSNDTLTLTVPKYTNITFNFTSNQTLTSCSWMGATQINCTDNSFAYKNFTTTGIQTVIAGCFNINGTCTNSKTWTINVTGIGAYILSGYVNNTLGFPIQSRVTDSSDSSKYALTDGNGNFEISGYQDGDTKTFIYQALGYDNQTASITFSGDTFSNKTLSYVGASESYVTSISLLILIIAIALIRKLKSK